MATVVTRYINPAADPNGDGTTAALTGANCAYQSRGAWHSARQRNLVTADEIEEVFCDTSGPSYPADIGHLNLDGSSFVSDADHYVVFRAAPASWAGTQWSNQKYRAVNSGATPTFHLYGQGSYWRLYGLQIEVDQTVASWCRAIRGLTATGILVDSCYVKQRGASAETGLVGIDSYNPGGGGSSITVRNTIVDGFSGTGMQIDGGGCTITAQNCTVVDCVTGLVGVTATNCGVVGSATPFSGGTQTTCSSAMPLFVGGGDYGLHEDDVVWTGQGTNLSASFITDINQEVRPVPWAIGADEALPPGLEEGSPPYPAPIVPPPIVEPIDPTDPTPVFRDGWGASVFADWRIDQHAALHWLVEIDLGNRTYRFSDQGMGIGGFHYHGALVMTSKPQQDIDVYTGRASACRCSVNLLPLPLLERPTMPDLRPIDLADYSAEDFVGAKARVYQWAISTSVASRSLIIRGHVTDATGTGLGNLSLDISDFSVHYAEAVRLPPYICTQELWPNADEDDKDRRAPICMGTFSNVELPNVHGGDDKHLIGYHIISVSGGRIGASSSTPTLTNTTDSAGTPVAVLDYSSNTENQDTVVNGVGAPDPDGSYAGTAGVVIANVADQLRWIAERVVGIPPGHVDRATFDAIKARTSSYLNALVIGADEDTDYFEAAGKALMPFGGSSFVERGLLVAKTVDFGRAPRVHLRDDELLVGTERIEWQGTRNIPSGLEIQYDYAWHSGRKQCDYLRKRIVSHTELVTFAKAKAAGAQVLKIEAPYIRDAATIQLLAETLKALYGKMRRIFTVRVMREATLLTMLDNVEITSSRLPSSTGLGVTRKMAVVIGIEYGLGTSALTLLEA